MIGDVEVSTGLKGAMHVRESISFFLQLVLTIVNSYGWRMSPE